MPLALILSSHVAASRVGGSAQALALAPFKIDAVVVPTVLFGRHPGWGAPGGAAVEDATFEGMLQGLRAHRTFGLADVLITGYFASAAQVRAAAGTIDAVSATAGRAGAFSDRCVVVVDPIMGDEGAGLYVKPEVAEAVAELLVPRADWLTPNAWELACLSGLPVTSAAQAADAASALNKPVLATSIPCGEGRIGLLLATGDRAVLFSHARLDKVPHGAGDLVTAVFAAGLIKGGDPFAAAERAARAAAETVQACADWAAPELPIVALGERLVHPTAEVRVERID
jgi:pyridoxine kinase